MINISDLQLHFRLGGPLSWPCCRPEHTQHKMNTKTKTKSYSSIPYQNLQYNNNNFCSVFLSFFSFPFTLQNTTYLYKMRRKDRSKNCGSCSYPPTQSNYFLGICFTKLLIKLKRSLNIYSWGYLGGPPTSSWLGKPNIWKYQILKILEIGFLFTQIWYRNIQNLELEHPALVGVPPTINFKL